MLRALALAEQSAVPVVRNNSVSGLRLVVSVMDGVSISGTGYSAYGTMAVRTTRVESRGFESERNVEKVRLKDWAGWASAWVVKREEASGGRGASSPLACALRCCCCFLSCRRRCGGNCSSDWSSGICWEAVVWFGGVGAAVVVEVARALPAKRRKSRHFERSKTRFERKKVAPPMGSEAAETRGTGEPADADESHRGEAATLAPCLAAEAWHWRSEA